MLDSCWGVLRAYADQHRRLAQLVESHKLRLVQSEENAPQKGMITRDIVAENDVVVPLESLDQRTPAKRLASSLEAHAALSEGSGVKAVTGTVLEDIPEETLDSQEVDEISLSLSLFPRSEDDLGALLRTWGVEDARAVLEANGFTSMQRMRDVFEVDDLPELGLPLATRKILARLLMSWADEKGAEQDAHLTQKVAGLLELCPEFASQEEADAATAEEGRLSVLYNSDAPKTIRKWQSFHRVISEKIATAAGSFQLRAVEEIQLDAPVNEEALNTSLVPPPSGEDRLRDTESLSGGRGGRYEAARKKLLAPPLPVTPGEKQKRHFRYRSREGDFFVKVVLTGEIADSRGDDEKEDALGDLMGMLSRGDLEADNVAGLGVDFDSLMSSMTSMSLGQGGVGNGNGGLILSVPDGFEEKLFGAQDKSVQALAYPHNLYEGEQVSLKTLRSTGQMRMPAPIAAGQVAAQKSCM